MIGPEILLGMAVVILSGCILILLIFILSTSLMVTADLSKDGSNISACGTICWGIFGLQFCWQQGHGIVRIQSRNHTLWSNPLRPARARMTKSSRVNRRFTREIPWRALLPSIMAALGYVRRHLRVEKISAEVVLGLPSAPETGTIYGYVQAARGILTPFPCISLQMTPDFDRSVCDGHLSCACEIRYPLILVFRLLQIGMHRPVRDLLTGAD